MGTTTETTMMPDAELDGLIAALADLHDPAAPAALADWLEEHQDPRAADVRQLVNVQPVIPTGRPSWERYTDDPDEWMEHSYQEYMPMACGPWWCIHRKVGGVGVSVYRHTPQYDSWFPIGISGDELAWVYLEPDVRPDGPSDEDILVAFEICRRILLNIAADDGRWLKTFERFINNRHDYRAHHYHGGNPPFRVSPIH
jgi:hypothetical protein